MNGISCKWFPLMLFVLQEQESILTKFFSLSSTHPIPNKEKAFPIRSATRLLNFKSSKAQGCTTPFFQQEELWLIRQFQLPLYHQLCLSVWKCYYECISLGSFEGWGNKDTHIASKCSWLKTKSKMTPSMSFEACMPHNSTPLKKNKLRKKERWEKEREEEKERGKERGEGKRGREGETEGGKEEGRYVLTKYW